jgi:hypothetical protein
VYAFTPEAGAEGAVRDRVDQIVVTAQDLPWTTEQWDDFAAGLALRKFVLTYDREGVRVYTSLGFT